MAKPVTVIMETGKKKVFASAADWPGWARGGVDEDAALDALVAYGSRYSDAIATAGVAFSAPKTAKGLTIVERIKGNATTDYGVPGAVAEVDSAELTAREMNRLVALLDACWATFDAAVEQAGTHALATGPRGGGRQTDAIIPHVVDANTGYLKTLGATAEEVNGASSRADLRALTLATLGRAMRGELPAKGPRGGKRWPPRYFVRRAAWHIFDHAWEIEDRLDRP